MQTLAPARLVAAFAILAALGACEFYPESPYLPEDPRYPGKAWARDRDGDGVADSVAKYAPGCRLSPAQCLDQALAAAAVPEEVSPAPSPSGQDPQVGGGTQAADRPEAGTDASPDTGRGDKVSREEGSPAAGTSPGEPRPPKLDQKNPEPPGDGVDSSDAATSPSESPPSRPDSGASPQDSGPSSPDSGASQPDSEASPPNTDGAPTPSPGTGSHAGEDDRSSEPGSAAGDGEGEDKAEGEDKDKDKDKDKGKDKDEDVGGDATRDGNLPLLDSLLDGLLN